MLMMLMKKAQEESSRDYSQKSSKALGAEMYLCPFENYHLEGAAVTMRKVRPGGMGWEEPNSINYCSL